MKKNKSEYEKFANWVQENCDLSNVQYAERPLLELRKIIKKSHFARKIS